MHIGPPPVPLVLVLLVVVELADALWELDTPAPPAPPVLPEVLLCALDADALARPPDPVESNSKVG